MFNINHTIPAKNTYRLDPHGHLAEIDDWSEEVASALAAEEGVTLTEEHWAVIRYLREDYLDRDKLMNAREALRSLEKEFAHQGGGKFLYRLFPGGPVRQGGRIAGLPELDYTADRSFGSFH